MKINTGLFVNAMPIIRIGSLLKKTKETMFLLKQAGKTEVEILAPKMQIL